MNTRATALGVKNGGPLDVSVGNGPTYRQLQAVAEAAAKLVKMKWWQAWPYGDWHEIEAALRAAGYKWEE
jgi:hypothetical protein